MDGISKVRGAIVAPLEQPVSSGASSTEEQRPLGQDLVRVDAKLLNPPNVRLELAYEVRQALGSLGSGSPQDKLLAGILAKGSVLNAPLLALSDALFPGVLRPEPSEVAQAIRGLPQDQLKAAFAEVEVQTQRLDALLLSGPKDQRAAGIVDRGRSILAKLAFGGSKERAFLDQISASSAGMGRLAEALDAKTAPAFLSKLRGASAGRLEQMVGFLETDRTYRSMMQSMAPDLRDSSPKDQVERSASFMTNTFGVPKARAEELALLDQSKASSALDDVRVSLVAQYGSAVVDSAFAAVPVNALLAPSAHVTQGGVIATRTAPFSAVDRVPVAEKALREEITRQLGESLLAGLSESADGKKLARLFDLPDSPRAKRILAGMMFEHYGSAEKLLADHRADPKAWSEEIADLKAVLSDIEATEREAERANRTRRAQLDGGVLVLPREAQRALESHMIAASPKEGLGYLLSDGEAVVFHPIGNDAKDAGFHGVQNEADLAKMNLFLEASGWFVLAQAHSHPNMRALYSPGDLAEMSGIVALAPGRRTVIAGVTANKVELMSFSSGYDGQVLGEDRIDAPR